MESVRLPDYYRRKQAEKTIHLQTWTIVFNATSKDGLELEPSDQKVK